jgi:hypothetical protein
VKEAKLKKTGSHTLYRRLAQMHEDILIATDQIMEGARRSGLTVRLLGGTAIRFRCPSATHRSLNRKVPDIDLITYRKGTKKLSEMFVELGLEPVKMFNALHGDKRMLFTDVKWERQVDVFIETFEMCHKFDFRKRMLLDDVTLPLADLLLTKLQIIEINEKDYKDVISLFMDHPISEKDDKESINAAYIASLCAKDWGIWRTITRNLDWTRTFLKGMDIEPDKKELVTSRINSLLERIEKEPKSIRWKMRSKIGDRVLWYDEPEKVGKLSVSG